MGLVFGASIWVVCVVWSAGGYFSEFKGEGGVFPVARGII